MRQVIKVAGVVAFKLKTSAVIRTSFKDEFDILKGVAEDTVPTAFEVWPLPIVFQFLEPAEHRIKAEIHRSHIEACNLRLERSRWAETLVNGHRRSATAGEVNDDIRLLLDAWQKL